MARPQNAPNGLFAKDRIDVGSNNITANSTALVLSAGIKISNVQTITANSTGMKFADYESSLPGNVDNGILIGIISNSTGVALFINSTGTTHKYLNVTSVQPT